MDNLIPFASREYWLLLAIVVFSRGMDFLSTWFATPNLVLEGNPLAKKLGWRWGAVLNVGICAAVAFEPVITIAISTTSLLVAARNFQSAWLMRTMGEEFYRDWHVARIQEARRADYLLCLAGNSLLPAGIGIALLYFSRSLWIPSAVGMGIFAYAVAVAFYTLLAFGRIRRAGPPAAERIRITKIQFANAAISPNMPVGEPPDREGCEPREIGHER